MDNRLLQLLIALVIVLFLLREWQIVNRGHRDTRRSSSHLVVNRLRIGLDLLPLALLTFLLRLLKSLVEEDFIFGLIARRNVVSVALFMLFGHENLLVLVRYIHH